MSILLCSGIGLYRPKIKLDGPLASGWAVFRMIRMEQESRMPSNSYNSQTTTTSNPPQHPNLIHHPNHLPHLPHLPNLTTKMIQYPQQDINCLIQSILPT
jgi:hypothetical protein